MIPSRHFTREYVLRVPHARCVTAIGESAQRVRAGSRPRHSYGKSPTLTSDSTFGGGEALRWHFAVSISSQDWPL